MFTEGPSPWLQRVYHRGYRGTINVITEGTRIDYREYITLITEGTHPANRHCPWYALVLYIAMIIEVVLDMPLLCTSQWLQRVHYRSYRECITVITEGTSPSLQRVNYRGYRGYITVFKEGISTWLHDTSLRLQRDHHHDYRGTIIVITKGQSPWLHRIHHRIYRR